MRNLINLTEDTGITDAWFKDGFQTYKKPNPEKYEIAQQDGTIQTLEGPVNYRAGYYILTGPKGEQYPIPPEKFAELIIKECISVAHPRLIDVGEWGNAMRQVQKRIKEHFELDRLD